jgi:recombination protein RecA
VVGSRHRVKIVKNKVAPPFRIAEFDMNEDGISHMGELLDVGIELEILTKAGAFIRWGETLLGQGRPASIAYLKENSKEAERLEKTVRETWAKQKAGPEPMVVGEEQAEEGILTEETPVQ